MTPYLILLSFIMLWMILEKKSINRLSVYTPLLALSLFAGIRSYRVGTDSWNYTQEFRNNTPIYNSSFGENVEYGYSLIHTLLLSLTHSYFWLFLFTAIIVVASYLFTIRKLSENYILSIFFFITLGTYTFFFNGLRQGIAMAIVAIAMPCLLQKNFKKFLLIVFLASAFHISALVVLPIYALLYWRANILFKLTGIFATTLLASGAIISYLASNNPRYETYTEENEAGGLVVLSFNIIMVIIIYLIAYSYKIKDKKFLLLLQFYAIGIAFIVPFPILGLNPSGPQRMLNYFSWVLVLLLPKALKKINNTIIYFFVFTLSIIYFWLTTTNFSNLVPYTLNPIFEIL
ncbi:EpsG family protein [Psychrobacter raelei]|uniref:EpsG family protein n=1 Tax=Psychrobacter raelei TaxID=2565531 RepID=UPI003F644A92